MMGVRLRPGPRQTHTGCRRRTAQPAETETQRRTVRERKERRMMRQMRRVWIVTGVLLMLAGGASAQDFQKVEGTPYEPVYPVSPDRPNAAKIVVPATKHPEVAVSRPLAAQPTRPWMVEVAIGSLTTKLDPLRNLTDDGGLDENHTLVQAQRQFLRIKRVPTSRINQLTRAARRPAPDGGPPNTARLIRRGKPNDPPANAVRIITPTQLRRAAQNQSHGENHAAPRPDQQEPQPERQEPRPRTNPTNPTMPDHPAADGLQLAENHQ